MAALFPLNPKERSREIVANYSVSCKSCYTFDIVSELSTCIAGSFKFKPEIDDLIDEFADLGVRVLETTNGWLFAPNSSHQIGDVFRPLPSEREMTLRQVEDRFLTAVVQTDFLYVHNPEGYMGGSASLELGFAHGRDIPIFASHPLTLANFEFDLADFGYWSSVV